MVNCVLDEASERCIRRLSLLPLESIVAFHAGRYAGPAASTEAKRLNEDSCRLVSEACAADIHDALNRYGISFAYSDMDRSFPWLIIRAEMSPSDRTITIYRPPQRELSELTAALPIFNPVHGLEEEMALAHELGHWLDWRDRRRPGGEPSVFGEIRAHLFTMKYLSLPLYPWLCDVLQLLYRDPGLTARFEEVESINTANQQKGQ